MDSSSSASPVIAHPRVLDADKTTLCLASCEAYRRAIEFIPIENRPSRSCTFIPQSKDVKYWIPYYTPSNDAESLIGLVCRVTLSVRGQSAYQAMTDDEFVSLPVDTPSMQLGVQDALVESHDQIAPKRKGHAHSSVIVTSTRKETSKEYPYFELGCIPLSDFLAIYEDDDNQAAIDSANFKAASVLSDTLVMLYKNLRGNISPLKFIIPLEDENGVDGHLQKLVTLMAKGHLQCRFTSVKLPVPRDAEPGANAVSVSVRSLQRRAKQPVSRDAAFAGIGMFLQWMATTNASSAEMDSLRGDMLELVQKHGKVLSKAMRAPLHKAMAQHLPEGKTLRGVMERVMQPSDATDDVLPIRPRAENQVFLDWLEEDLVSPLTEFLFRHYIRWAQTLGHILRLVCKMRGGKLHTDPSNYPWVLVLFAHCLTAIGWYGDGDDTTMDCEIHRDMAYYLECWEATQYSVIYNGMTHRLLSTTLPGKVGLDILQKDPWYSIHADQLLSPELSYIHEDTEKAIHAKAAKLSEEQKALERERRERAKEEAKLRAQQAREEWLTKQAVDARVKKGPAKRFDPNSYPTVMHHPTKMGKPVQRGRKRAAVTDLDDDEDLAVEENDNDPGEESSEYHASDGDESDS